MTKKKKIPWSINILTLFPEMFPGPVGCSLAGKALQNKIWKLSVTDIREFANSKSYRVDDAPFGGGSGMIMRPDILDSALRSLKINNKKSHTLIYPTPRGKMLNQSMIRKLAKKKEITIICGRYEGVDERFIKSNKVEEISIGDYLLSGGELAAIVIIDSCLRLLPGVLGNKKSLDEETFETGLLEYPHYTRPQKWKGLKVPKVLISGHHKKIQEWRYKKSLQITKKRRSDLWKQFKENKVLKINENN